MSINKISQIRAYDDLNPIEKYKKLNKDFGLELPAHLGEYILLAMLVVDRVLKQVLKVSYNYYIYSDESVLFLLRESLRITFTEQNFINSVLLIDDSKLIYRFTCAKKFAIMDDRIKQLRLNSWGKEYINHMKLTEKYNSEINRMEIFFADYLYSNKSVYMELTHILLDFIDNETCENIKLLNRSLDIKLLS